MPAHCHKMEHRGVRGDYKNYSGQRYGEHPQKRVALSAISVNLGINILKNSGMAYRKTSIYRCYKCNIPLCKEGHCFEQYHQIQ